MKKIAIVVDDHKLPKFRQGLEKLGLVSTETPFVEKTTVMKVLCHESRIADIHKMCMELEINFNQSN